LTPGGIAKHDAACSRERPRDGPPTSGPLLLGPRLGVAVSLRLRASGWGACGGRDRPSGTAHRGCSNERRAEVDPPLGSLGVWTAPRAHRSRSGRRGERAGVRRQLVRHLGLPTDGKGNLTVPVECCPCPTPDECNILYYSKGLTPPPVPEWCCQKGYDVPACWDAGPAAMQVCPGPCVPPAPDGWMGPELAPDLWPSAIGPPLASGCFTTASRVRVGDRGVRGWGSSEHNGAPGLLL
jgi:hypothetical protein